MNRIFVAAAALAAWVSAGFGGIGVNWTAGGRVYGPDGTAGIAAETPVVWQLIHAGPDGVADAPGSLGGDDTVLATRMVPAGGGAADDGTVWDAFLAKVDGDSVYEDLSWSSAGHVYQRMYQGTPEEGTWYFQSGLVALDTSYSGGIVFPAAFGAAAEAAGNAAVADRQVGGPGWKYTVENGEATVTGADLAVGNLVLPEKLGGVPVTGIGYSAFENCWDLTSLAIPDGVVRIEEEAFVFCESLRSVSIGRGVAEIGMQAFYGCGSLEAITVNPENAVFESRNGVLFTKGGGTLVCCPPRTAGYYAVPADTTEIGDEAFACCSNLTSIAIADGVTGIGSGAFVRCSGLETLSVPDSVDDLSPFAFSGCDGLVRVLLPGAFSGTEILERLAVPEGCEVVCRVVCTVVLDARGGSNGTASVTATCGFDLPDIDVPEREGAAFRGYFSEPGGQGTQYYSEAGTGVRPWDRTADATLYAHWPLSVTVTDVTARQRYPWNGMVDIDFTVSCSEPEAKLTLYASARDEGTGKAVPVRTVKLEGGGFGEELVVRPQDLPGGKGRLVWDAGKDAPGLVADAVTVEVQALAGEGMYLVVDLSAGSGDGAVYPVSFLGAEPQGGWGDEFKTTKLVLRRMLPGSFTMGSPPDELGRYGDSYSYNEIQHEVTISQPFYIGVFEVTQKQWELVMGSNPSYYAGDMRPVEYVSWNDVRGTSSTYNWPSTAEVDAASFMGKLRSRASGFAWDLPTEAQWEYACRAGTATALNSGKNLTRTSDDANMAEVGRYSYNQSDGKGGYTSGHTTVGSYVPNAWGLYDMHGNVFEWCLDSLASVTSAAVTDPVGPASGSYRVQRGGSWCNNAQYCRSANRYYNGPSYRDNCIGLRLCCSAGLR